MSLTTANPRLDPWSMAFCSTTRLRDDHRPGIPVARKRRLGLSQDSRNTFALLECVGIIDTDTTSRTRAMIGFRNMTVHWSQDLSVLILRSTVDSHLVDFSRFTSKLFHSQPLQK